MVAASTDNTVGAAFVGCLMSAILFGVTITQSVSYFQNRPSDSWVITLVVIVSLVFDVFLTILVAHGTYIYSVKSLDDPHNLMFIPWSYRSLTFVTGISVAVVRCFFVRRIWFLSNKRVSVTGVQVVLMVGAFVAATVAGVRMILITTFEELARTPWIVYSTRITNMVADISIAGTTLFYLYKSSTGYKGTAEVVNALILFVVGTGIVSVVWDILEASTYAATSNTLLFVIFFYSLSKLYANALLASLNARNMMQRKLEPRSSLLIFSEESRGAERIFGNLSSRPVSGDLELVLPSHTRSEMGSITSTLDTKAEHSPYMIGSEKQSNPMSL